MQVTRGLTVAARMLAVLAIGSAATSTCGGSGNPPTTTTTASTSTTTTSTSTTTSTTLPTVPGANPLVAIAAPPDPIAPGQAVTSPITVTNNGDTDATSATVVVTYPKSTSTGASVAFTAAAGITCSYYNPRYGANQATCTLASVASGATTQLATVKVTAPTSVPYAGITVAISAAGPLNTASATYRIRDTGPADLVPSVYVATSPVLVNRPDTATVTIADNGYSAANDVATRIDLPAGSVPGALTAPAGTSCNVNGDGFDCTTATLANGASTTLTVPFTTPAAGALATVRVTVDAANVVAEANESNNSATAAIDIRDHAPALQVAITNPPVAYQGTLFTRTIEVTNVGDAIAPSVTLADRFTGIGYVGYTGPAGTSCTVATSYSGRPATLHYIGANCALGDIAPGATVPVTLTLSVPGTLSANTYSDTATASTLAYTNPDVNPSATGTTTVAVPATPYPPANVSLPSVTGDGNTGSTLSLATGTWVAKGTVTYAYQWMRCDAAGDGCTPIADATASTYVVQQADVGATLRAEVLATNAGGTTSATSAPTPVIVAAVAPANVTPPSLIAGLEKQPTFAWSVSPGTWSGTPTITFAYQWMRCDIGGGNCTDIAGATSSSYVLQTDDVFHSVQVRVTATNTGGNAIAYSNVSPEIDPLG